MADPTVRLNLDAVVGGVSPPEEAGLLTSLRAGNEEAYETLILLYQHPVYNLVCRLLNDPEDASDIVQEVFLKVFRNVG
ncbi:MAG: RNA polymerase subunit sigma-24, partial [Acidobacteriota bacterium]|nr:RNA polymerase subunit sigma-24 [Acidobacteriota bacterium]